ncbi:RNA-splicing factor [Puccinia graminis f. sp. tritici]|uniref:RNA-splicing factor n=1 Tax=Puccinia graminis f. sp. tritici TaxID=56615 RepID=A0A5B0S6E5_PUCGR|nr:RNA-splicing factor [Puccinia graminis f. sp. tritici]
MGGGDLNMKKSWHPLLMKNQERVWKEERKALEERKKTAQLQKELAEERQLQELQRIQAEQGGGRREERVDWLYATPAIGNGINAEEQEAYLLGKKTVDKLFKEKDEAAAKVSKALSQLCSNHIQSMLTEFLVTKKISPQLQARAASQSDADKAGGGFISLQNANTARDTASKIREDPLLAIKQQEQLAYENLKKNPARVKSLQSSLTTKEQSRKEKEERKQLKRDLKEARKRRHDPAEDARGRSSEGRNESKRARGGKLHSRESDQSVSPDGHSRSYRRGSPDRRHSPDRRPHRRHSPPSPDDRRRSDSPDRTSRPSRRTSDHPSGHHRRTSTSPDHRHRGSRHTGRSRSRSPSRTSRNQATKHTTDREPPHAHHSSNERNHHKAPLPGRSHHDSSSRHYPDSGRPRNPPTSFQRSNQGPSYPPTSSTPADRTTEPAKSAQKLSEAKAAKLAEMQAAAKSLQESRSQRLQKLEAEDSERMKIEEAERERNRIKSGGVGDGNKAKFVMEQEKKVFFGQMGLAERVKRSGGVGLLKDKE